MTNPTDLYAVLGVAPDCEDFVIQAAYRALMRRYHPDTNKDPEAAARAQIINAAYAVLGDPQKRSQYDLGRGKNSRERQSSTNEEAPNSAQGSGGSKPPQPPESDKSEIMPFAEGRGGMAAVGFLLILGIAGVIFFTSLQNAGGQSDQYPPSNLDEAVDALEPVENSDMNMDAGVIGNEIMPAKLSELPQTPVAYPTIEGAANRFVRILMNGGISEARSYSQNCHKQVQENPSWDAADSCAAFDFAAAYVDRQISAGRNWVPSGYFKFQQENMDDTYEAAGASPYTVSMRVIQIRRAVEPAAEEAVQMALAKQRADEARAAREAAPSDPFADAPSSDASSTDVGGAVRSD